MKKLTRAAPLVGLLAAGPVMGLAPMAHSVATGSTVELTGEALVFRAGDGLENNVNLSGNVYDGTIALSDASGAPITSLSPDCTVDGSNVECPSAGIRIFQVFLGDKDDVLYGAGPWWTPTGVFDIHGGSGDDSIEGNLWGYGDTLYGNAGDDWIKGLSGFDSIMGGRGNDHIDGGSYADQLLGGPGRDIVKGGNGADGISGGAGSDRLSGERGKDVLDSRDGFKDYVFGGAGTDTVTRDRMDVVRGVEKTK